MMWRRCVECFLFPLILYMLGTIIALRNKYRLIKYWLQPHLSTVYYANAIHSAGKKFWWGMKFSTMAVCLHNCQICLLTYIHDVVIPYRATTILSIVWVINPSQIRCSNLVFGFQPVVHLIACKKVEATAIYLVSNPDPETIIKATTLLSHLPVLLQGWRSSPMSRLTVLWS